MGVKPNAPNGQTHYAIASDGHGGALIVWEDYRTGGLRQFALRVNGDGTSPPGWAALGNRVSLALPAQHGPGVVTDGTTGLYAFWAMSVDGRDHFFVQHMDGDGQFASGWDDQGRVFVSPGDSFVDYLVVISDGAGGAIGTYERGDEVWAHRLHDDGTTATRPTLVSGTSAGDEATLVWSMSDATSLDFRVERRTETTHWTVIGTPEVMSGHRLQFIDRDLPAGLHAYRLAYGAAPEGYTPEVWVEIHDRMGLALEGFRPNPVAGTATVVFSLPDDRPARLELLDVRGRVVRSRSLDGMGRGAHVLSFAQEGAMGAGMYWVRLIHPDGTLATRGVVVR